MFDLEYYIREECFCKNKYESSDVLITEKMAQKIEQYKHTHKKNELSEIEINQTILK
jgi:hypothetical protein